MTNMNGYFQLSNKYDGTYLGLYPAKGGGIPARFEEVKEYLTDNGMSNYDINTLKNALKNHMEYQEVKLTSSNIGSVNETLKIYVSEDRLMAIARFYPPSTEGRHLTEQEIMDVIGRNVKNGIIMQNIYLYLANRKYCEDIVVARGKKPSPGEEAKILYFFKEDKSLKPELNENGTVNFHKLNIFNSVKKDQVLATLTPERQGLSGMDVYGNLIAAKAIKKKKLIPGKNTYLSEDGLSILSEINGHVIFANDKVWVSDIYEIKKDVDPSTGDIRYNGSVHVPGNILTGYSIYATGDVFVNGIVEGAHIEAGGNITLQRGMKGKKRGFLKAGGNIVSKFIENSEVYTDAELICEELLHSKVTAKGEVIVLGGKGLITGSIVRSEKKISTRTAGSVMGAETLLEVSHDFDLLEGIQSLNEEIAKKKKEFMKLITIVNNYNTKIKRGENLSKQKLDYFKKATQECVGYNNEIKELTEKLEHRKKNREDALTRMSDWSIVVERHAYQGVQIIIGPSGYTVESDKQSTKFIREKGEIKLYEVLF